MNLYDTAREIGERSHELAILLLREQHHEAHRIGVMLNDLSLAIKQAMTALSDETRERIAELGHAE
jgi:hypothetical protein